MRAISVSAFGGEDQLGLAELPVPEPGPGEIRVRVGAAGVNPVETYIRSGNYAALPKLPYTPGNDAAGLVDALGTGVQGLAVGQRVFTAAALARRNTGSYAEYMVCDASCVRPLPDGCSFAEGAGLGTPGLAASYALFSKARLQPGETVLVHGATGGMGSLALQLARRVGATVLGTAGSARGEAMLRDLGAHLVFNHAEPGYLDRIREAVPAGPDVIVESLANVNLGNDLALLARRGRIVIVGSRGNIDFAPREAMAKDAAIFGLLLTNMRPEVFSQHMFRLSAALETGLRVVVASAMPLERAPEAHREVMHGSKPGKIVLTTGLG